MSKKLKLGYLQVGVETYGGGIWHSWFDRDLALAGRVVIADKNGNFSSKLVRIDRPLLRIPTLAIHRKRLPRDSKRICYSQCLSVERGAADNFQFNTETEFVPILGLVASQLNSKPGETMEERRAASIQDNHHPEILSLLANELSVAPEYIHDFELSVLVHFIAIRY